MLTQVAMMVAAAVALSLFAWVLHRRFQRLRLHDTRLALAIDAPGAGVFDWQVDTGELLWTREAERSIGLAAGAMRSIDMWRERTDPEDLAAIDLTIQAAAANRGAHFPFRFRIRTEEGGQRSFEGSARCFYNRKGELIRVVGINLDVTERDERRVALEERERQLRTIMQNVPDAMLVVDAAGIVRIASQTATPMLGYGDGGLVGRHVARLIPQDSAFRRLYLHAGDRTMFRQLFGRTVSLTGRRASGETFPAELRVAEVTAHSGTLYILFVRDVTERVRAEQRLDELRDEFAHRARINAMGEMVAGIAHELGQPLAAGANYLFAAEARPGATADPQLADLIGHARSQFQRAGEIIQRLRGFLSKARFDMTVERFEDLAIDARELVRAGYQGDAATISIEIARGAERVLADRVQIQQVLVNLIRNALEAMRGPDLGRQHVTVTATPWGQGFIEVEVRDQGNGFPPGILDRMFTPFLSTKDAAGMGIGLSICKRIVEAHGGEIRAFNREDGASVVFTLPRP